MLRKNQSHTFLPVALLALIILIVGFSLPVTGQEGPDGESLFNARCSGCHKLGEGDSIGPDLLGITDVKSLDYLIGFTLDPESMKDSEEYVPNAAFTMSMPPMSLSREEVAAIFEYTSNLGTTTEPVSTEDAVEEPVASPAVTFAADDESFERGEVLYEDHCTTCHSIGGGRRIGADLAGVTRVRDREWLKQVLLDPSTYQMPMPQFGFDDHEIEAIITFLENVDPSMLGGFTETIGKPVPETVVGTGEADAVMDYIFGPDRLDTPKTGALDQPKTWKDIPGVARILVILAAVLFIIFLLAVMLEAAIRKKPMES